MQTHSDNTQSRYDGVWVRSNRRRVGLRQDQLAARIDAPNGINPGRISEIETGKRDIRPEWLEDLRAIFGDKN